VSKTPRAAWIAKTVLTLAGAGVFCTGITWGLPSRAVDPYLFGDRPVWTGKEILELAGQRTSDPSRGADVDVDPLVDRENVICVNETDAQRAEIVRRYRLYTYHPDEMVTMMSLGSMRPGEGDFDPKLYQYGGLWIYPGGALLRLASAVGAITLTSDLAWYLDRPEEFGRFYVVARMYVVGWALVGVWVVFALARRLSNGNVAAATMAAVFYIVMPVIITISHEAKPHLPGAILVLMTVLAAIRYVDTGKAAWWLITGCLCGAAAGMILTALPVFAILPTMVLLRSESWRKGIKVMLAAGGGGIVVYFLTNPYVLVNLFVNRELLRSNLGNTAVMFELSRFGEAMRNAADLVGEGAGLLLAAVGVIGVIVWMVRLHRGRSSNIGWLLAVPALLVLLQFTVAAAGQPGPYGRFAVLPDIALGIAVAVSMSSWKRGYRAGIWALCILVTLPWTYSYLAGFISDCSHTSSRMLWADRLRNVQKDEDSVTAIVSEPAPYVLPPLNLFDRRITLMPQDPEAAAERVDADLIVMTWDQTRAYTFSGYRWAHKPVSINWPTRISWANKWFAVLRKESSKDEVQLQR
jgi:hypothetical protein